MVTSGELLTRVVVPVRSGGLAARQPAGAVGNSSGTDCSRQEREVGPFVHAHVLSSWRRPCCFGVVAGRRHGRKRARFDSLRISFISRSPFTRHRPRRRPCLRPRPDGEAGSRRAPRGARPLLAGHATSRREERTRSCTCRQQLVRPLCPSSLKARSCPSPLCPGTALAGLARGSCT